MIEVNNKSEHWKYGYVSNSGDIYLYQSRKEMCHSILFGHFLENVDLVEKGSSVRIIGEERIFIYFPRLTYEDEWDSEPIESDIKVRKTWIFFGPNIKYVERGWVERKERKYFDMTLSGTWTIRRYE